MTREKERYGEVEEQVAILQGVFKDGFYCEVTPELEIRKGHRTFRYMEVKW